MWKSVAEETNGKGAGSPDDLANRGQLPLPYSDSAAPVLARQASTVVLFVASFVEGDCWLWEPELITIGCIDEIMVEDTTLVNRDLLLEEIHSESPSLEHFFRQNFGFCAGMVNSLSLGA